MNCTGGNDCLKCFGIIEEIQKEKIPNIFVILYIKWRGLQLISAWVRMLKRLTLNYIGNLTTCDHVCHGLSWIKTIIDTLGIVIIDNDDNNYKHNFQQRITNLKAIPNIWKQRKLSLKWQITVLHNLALDPLIYYLVY